MKKTLNTYEIVNALLNDKTANWSYNGAKALAEYLEQYEEDCGVELELDAVALRCNYAEYESLYRWADEYFAGDAWMAECGLDTEIDYEERETHDDNIRNYICAHGQLIEFEGGIIVSEF